MRMWADNQLTQWPRSSCLVALWSCIWRWTPGKILEKRSKNFTFKIQCLTYVYHCSLHVFTSEMANFERTWQPYSVHFYVTTIFDREQLANAVQGITIWLVDLLPTFCKPFTQFEAYYIMLCSTSLDLSTFVWRELTEFFKTFIKI